MSIGSQKEMEEYMRSFVERINKNESDTMCGLVKPSFVSCDYATKTLTMSYPGQYWERNPLNVMQGGVVATLLDFTAGCLSVCLSNKAAVTVSMQVSYLRPAPIEGTVIVRSTATKSGRTLIHSFTECWAESTPDKLAATAVCVYMA